MASDRFVRRKRPNRGIHQRELSRITCEWGQDVRSHAVALAVFGPNYKVKGILAYSPGQEPLWYGEPPNFMGRHGMRFKAPFDEGGPLPVSETDPEVFEDTFVCDSWGLVEDGMRAAFAEQERPMPMNVSGQMYRGQQVTDVVFEPSMHSVRSVVLRRGLFRVETRPVMTIPSLMGNLRAVPRDKPRHLRFPWIRGS